MDYERHYEITIKEKSMARPIKTTYVGYLDEDGIIKFFGLHNSDVEWYKIKVVMR